MVTQTHHTNRDGVRGEFSRGNKTRNTRPSTVLSPFLPTAEQQQKPNFGDEQKVHNFLHLCTTVHYTAVFDNYDAVVVEYDSQRAGGSYETVIFFPASCPSIQSLPPARKAGRQAGRDRGREGCREGGREGQREEGM